LQPEGNGWSPFVPHAGETLTVSDADRPDLKAFVLSLRQLRFEFGAFGDDPEATALFAELNKKTIASTSQRLGDFLKAASALLVDASGSVSSIRMPDQWPKIVASENERIRTLVMSALAKRLRGLAAREGRFDDSQRRYRVRTFIRVKAHDGCPEHLIWSDYSEPFRIAPWYDSSSGVPPVQITLPDVTDGN